MRSYVVEGVGTFFLALAVFTGNPLTIGLTLMAVVYLGSHISSGYYNPAVAFAAWLYKGRDIVETVKVVAAQLVGAVGASAFSAWYTKVLPLAQSAAGYETVQVFTAEALYAAAFCLVVLSVTHASVLRGNTVYGLVIGFAFTAFATLAGPVSGGILNPAVGAGSLLYHAFNTETALGNHLLVYSVGPLVGGAVAAYVYRYLND